MQEMLKKISHIRQVNSFRYNMFVFIINARRGREITRNMIQHVRENIKAVSRMGFLIKNIE